jgi:hypothetical protein
MALTGTHSAGDTGHVGDHNLIDAKLTDLQSQITTLSGSLPDATNSVKGRVMLTNDFGGSAGAPTVVATHLTAALPIAQGGTGSTTQNFVHNNSTQTISGAKTFVSSPIVPTPSASGSATNKAYVDATASAGTPDADATTKGKHKLTNDLAGTADLPTVVATHLSSPLPIAQGGTASMTRTWVDLSSTETINGVKSFGSSPKVPTPSASGDAASKSYVDTQGGSAAVTTHEGTYHVFDIRHYGGVGDGVTDNTTAFTNALIAASGATTNYMKYQTSGGNYMQGAGTTLGAAIYVPRGEWVVGNLVLPHRTSIVGEGWDSILVRKAATTGDWITNRRDSTVHAAYCKVINLTLHGNRDNQSVAGVSVHWYGDSLTSPNFQDNKDEDWDVHCEVRDCQLIYGLGGAIQMTGSGENKIVNNFVRSYSTFGIYSEGADNWIIGNSVGQVGTRCYWVAGDDVRITGNKAWYAGIVTAAQGQGYYITSDSGVGSGNSAQDCTAQGVLFDNAFGWSWTGFMADSCSKGSSGTYAGIDLFNSQYISIDGVVRNRYNVGGPCLDAVNHSGGADLNFGDVVAAKGVWGVTNSKKSGSTISSSVIRVNGVVLT